MTRYGLVLITSPKKDAKRIAQAILRLRLAACVSILPAVSSHYWWKGKIESASESLLLAKTRKELFARLSAEVTRVHPYDVPEIIMVPLTKGSKRYLAWLNDETHQ